MDYGGQKGIERALELGKIRQVGTKIVSNGAMVRVDILKTKKANSMLCQFIQWILHLESCLIKQ